MNAPPHRHERGFAAAAALLMLLLASLIAAAMVDLARLETMLARARKVTAAALAAVDACVENAVAALPAGWEFSNVLLGSDGLPGTSDDGSVVLPTGCLGSAAAPPGNPVPPRLLLTLEADARGGRRRLEAVVRRHADPGVPALLWIEDAAAIGRVAGTLALDGIDIARPGRVASILAAPGAPEALDAWIASHGTAIAATAGTAPPIWAPPPPLGALAARAASTGALAPSAALVAVPPAPAHLTRSAGDLVVTSPQWGAGLLVVEGVLRIEAPFAFSGIVAATGGVQVGATGRLDVEGALWLGAGSLEALAVDGDATVVASAAALATADALLSLPRPARLASVRDF